MFSKNFNFNFKLFGFLEFWILGVFVIILFLAAALRLVNLNSFPIFADEAIYIRWAQVMRAEPSLRFLPLSDGKQPLFMWAVIPFLKFFPDPLVAGRTLSALIGLGTTVGVSVAAYILFKNLRLAVISGLIWAVLPYSVFFERMALVDSMLTLFYIWFFNFMSLSLSLSRLDFAMLAGISLGLAWLTKSPAIFALALSPSLFLFLPKFKPKNYLVAGGWWLAAGAIAASMYNILRLGPEFHQIALRNRDYVFSLPEVLGHPLDPLISHLKDSFAFYLYLTTPIGLLFILWGLFDGQKHHWRQRLVLSVWLLVPIFAQSFIAKSFTARYLLSTLPFAVIIIAHAINHLGERTRFHLLSFVAAGALVLASLTMDLGLIFRPQWVPLPRVERAGYLEEWTAGFGLKEVSAHIRRFAQSGPVVVGSEGYFGTPFSALQLYLNQVPNVRVTGVGVWIDSVHQNLKNALGENQVFLVVNSSRLHIDDPAKVGLELLASYAKAAPPVKPTEHLLFFRVKSSR